MQHPIKILESESDLKCFLYDLQNYIKFDLNFFEKRYEDNFSKKEIELLIKNLNEVISLYNFRINKIIEKKEYKKYLELKEKYEK